MLTGPTEGERGGIRKLRNGIYAEDANRKLRMTMAVFYGREERGQTVECEHTWLFGRVWKKMQGEMAVKRTPLLQVQSAERGREAVLVKHWDDGVRDVQMRDPCALAASEFISVDKKSGWR